MKKIILASSGALALPTLAFAALGGTSLIIEAAGQLIQRATVIVAGIALLVFFWGLVKFIMKASEGDVKNGKQLMVGGTIAIFVMVSIWGIVYFIGGEIFPGQGNDYYTSPPVPTFSR